MKRPVVYGIFSSGRCLYVGRTTQMKSRRKDHLRHYAKLCHEPEFRILKRPSFGTEANAERQAINKFKAKGEAEHNRITPKRASYVLAVSLKLHAVVREIASLEGKKLHRICDDFLPVFEQYLAKLKSSQHKKR